MAVENWQMPAIGAGAAFLGSIPQMVEARRLRKERERLLKEGAPGLTPIEQEQMAAARARAASALAPGYAQEMEGIAQQQADVLAAGKRGSQTSSNLMNLLSRMNAQGQAARRNLAMRGAQAQRAAQGELTNLSMSADARRENRMRRYEDDLSAMDAARRQYNAAAAMSPVQGALAFMPTEGLKFTKGKEKPDMTIPSEGRPMTFGENLEYQSQYNRPSATDNVPRNLPLAPSNLRMPLTGLEREPSMMAAPYMGETEKEYLIRNPLMNTSIRPRYIPNISKPSLETPQQSINLLRTPSMMRMAPQAADMGPGATPINTENFHFPESLGKPPIKNGVFGKTVFRYNDLGNPEVFFPNGRARGNMYGVNPYEFPYEVKDSGYILRDPR